MSRSAFTPSAADSAAGAEVRIDRSAAERDDQDLLPRLLHDPRTRVLAVRRDAAPLVGGRLALVELGRLRGAATGTAETTVRGVREWAFLGRDGDGGAIVLAVLAEDAPGDLVADASWAPLRAAAKAEALPMPEEPPVMTTCRFTSGPAGWSRRARYGSRCARQYDHSAGAYVRNSGTRLASSPIASSSAARVRVESNLVGSVRCSAMTGGMS